LEVGMMQAVFDFCSKSDPSDDKRFALKSKTLPGNQSDHDRDDLRNNADFKRGYGIMQGLLAKVRKADAAKGCAQLLLPHDRIAPGR
jgi:hypothetical protein